MKHQHVKTSVLRSAISATLLTSISFTALAQDSYWQCADDQWGNNTCWSTLTQPQTGDNVFLTSSSSSPVAVNYQNVSAPSAVLNSLIISGSNGLTLHQSLYDLNTLNEIVGDNSQGAVVQNAGTHNVTTTLTLGNTSTGVGRFDVSNSASLSSDILNIGNEGTGHLNVDNGGTVSSRFSILGVAAGSNGSATIDGSGSSWTNSSFISVGSNGVGTLHIQNGGTVSSRGMGIGGFTGSKGSVTVDGNGSILNNSDELGIGYQGDGTLSALNDATVTSTGMLILGFDTNSTGTLNINSGATVSNSQAVMGDFAPDSKGAAIVDGAGSRWVNNGSLTIGNNGDGDLSVQNGGVVTSTSGVLAAQAGSSGNVTIDGTGSRWDSSGSLFVGDKGDGTLHITNFGAVTSTNSILGNQAGSSGNVLVENGASWEINNTLNVGRDGSGSLTAREGARISSNGATVDGVDGIVIIDEAHWTNNGNLGVGGFGTGTLYVDGLYPTGGNTGVFNSGDLGVGTDGGNGQMTITGYSEVSNVNANVGTNRGTGTVLVDGASALWNNSGNLAIGEFGTGSLDVINGGTVTSTDAVLGKDNGNGNATVDGTGSSWNSNGKLSIGENGTGSLNIQNGGLVSSNQGWIGYTGGTGSVTVDGSDSRWDNTGNLFLGNNYATETGTLTIENAGSVEIGGFLQVNKQGVVNLTNGVLIANSIDTTISGSQFNFTGGTLAVETFNGNLTNQGGTLAPGNSPGVTTVYGNYSQNINSTLAIDIGGLMPGTEYDVLNITGTAELGGTLDVDFYDWGSNLFSAALGDSFDILSAETLSGEFDFLSLATLNAGLQWQIDYLVDFDNTIDIVRLSVVTAVPTPAAVWLFSSGLFFLAGMAKRKLA